jgi:hypothetical protein
MNFDPMSILILSLFKAPSFFFFLLITTTFLVIKKMAYRHKRIILNSIWFSENGSLPEVALNNLIRLSNKIKASPYSKAYQLFLWTDLKKLQPSVKKALAQQGITIKDYRHIKANDEASKQMNTWIHELIQLGDNDNNYFYCMASDLFRVYLLLKEFPQNYKNAVTCYLDCNDIEILSLPPPSSFKNLPFIALNPINITLMNTLGTLIGYEKQPLCILDNDIILASNRKKEPLNHLFRAFYSHLSDLNQRTGGMITKLTEMKQTMTTKDQDLIVVLVVGISHILNILRFKDPFPDPFLIEYGKAEPSIKPIKGLAAAFDFLDYNRHYENGNTWHKKLPTQNPDTRLEKECRESWYELYTQRFHKISQSLNQRLAEANIAALL